MKTIKLSGGKSAMVDDEDYERLIAFKWHWHRHKETKNRREICYAIRNASQNGKRTTPLMHREILRLSRNDGRVDHKDGNGLNNQKDNLRLATASQNLMNQIPNRNRHGYKGVVFDPRGIKKFSGRVTKEGRTHYTKYFDTPKEAAQAYNAKALELFGEFARLNPI